MSKLTRQSADSSDISGEDRKEYLKARNAESCKCNRKKWKESNEEIKKIYDSNENRIKSLEKLVETLSYELKHGGSSSSSGKSNKQRRT